MSHLVSVGTGFSHSEMNAPNLSLRGAKGLKHTSRADLRAERQGGTGICEMIHLAGQAMQTSLVKLYEAATSCRPAHLRQRCMRNLTACCQSTADHVSECISQLRPLQMDKATYMNMAVLQGIEELGV